MNTPTQTPSGATYGYDSNGNKVCTGSRMGRRSWLEHAEDPVKVYLKKLKWIDGDYDEQGAYWGYVAGTNIYRANFDIGDTNEGIFVRACNRQEAKEMVREQLPNARFFN